MYPLVRCLSPRALLRDPIGPVRKFKLAHTRTFVSYQLFRALQEAPFFELAINSFTIQGRGLCAFNSSSMHHSLVQAAAGAGLLVPRQPEEEPAKKDGWLGIFSWKSSKSSPRTEHPLFDYLVEGSRKFGPGVLKMQRMAERNDTIGLTYVTHHCAVLLFCFTYRHRTIGVLLDGNDLQSNPAVEALCEYVQKYRKSPSELAPSEFEEINKEVAVRSEAPLDVRQMGIRLVDLRAMVLASQEKYASLVGWIHGLQPNLGRFDEAYGPSQALLPAEVEQELVQLIDENPEVVETQFA